ncbi:hypothetical protein PFISCL1PPCAC_25972, partial [Pristionchus fissidentatus]
QMLSHLAYPSKAVDGKHIVRIDCFYSVVFEAGAVMRYADMAVTERDSVSTIHFVLVSCLFSLIPIPVPVKAEIYSECLKIGSSELAVSRELLAIRSDYFSSLFYGSYLEKTQELKEIKDIAESEFINFIQMLHRRRFEFNSVRSALDALGFADRFLMPGIAAQVLPYLKGKSLSDELLDYAIIAADRVPNNEAILAWVLPQFTSKLKLLEVVHAALPAISAVTAQMFL